MANPSPLQYGQYYHIYNRGNNRECIFVEERNYRSDKPTRLCRDDALAWFNGRKGFIEAHHYEANTALPASLVPIDD